MNRHEHGPPPERPSAKGSSRSRIAFAVFLAAALFFLLTEHRAHLFGYLPFLLILACVLMHLFHHGGHGRQGHRKHGAGASSGVRPGSSEEN